MKIWVNGTETFLKKKCLVSTLLAHLKVSGRFAVEINGKIVPRNTFDSVLISEDDKIEIVKAIGGG